MQNNQESLLNHSGVDVYPLIQSGGKEASIILAIALAIAIILGSVTKLVETVIARQRR